VTTASVTDIAGNSGPAAPVSSNTVTLDTIAPDAPLLTSLPGPFTASHAISPSFTMDARFTYRCEFDGNTVACGAGTINLGTQGSPIADGNHTLKVWATDQAGNVSTPFSKDFTVGAYQTPLTPNVPTVARPVRTELDVSWNQPTSSVEVPVVGYTLQYNIDGINWITATTITDPTQTRYLLTTARSGL
jgi:predicted phage tail protein